MSQKYKLVQDKEMDGADASIKRHIGVLLWVVLVPAITLVTLIFVTALGDATGNVIHRQEQAEFSLTWEALKVTPTP